MGENDTPKASEDHVKYDAPDVPSEWLVNDTNRSNTSSGIITMGSSMVEVSSCPSGPMLDSFCPPIWDQSINGQNLGYCNVNVQTDGTSSSMGLMSNTMLRDTMFLPTFPRMIPPSLPPFPHDSAFIERAARFSCFNEGSFSEMVSLVSIPEPLNPCSRPNEAFTGDGLKRSPGNVVEVAKDAEGRILRSENDEAKNVLNNESDEAEISGGGGESSGKGLGLKKRKRIEQKIETSEAPQPDEDPSSTSNPGGKHGKQESQVSDPPKEEYIHIRARRGQATNSHSLAERIRREKISERMKFLQDLVPGCSKVTGKAVMLDEIINYVQSLQRQVEFLSMKLATVNPQLDFNVEGFIAKDMLHSRAVLPSTLSFPHDIAMPFPLLHQPQLGPSQAGLLGLRNSSESLQRPIELESTVVSGGLSQPTSQHMQATGVWEDELHNVVHNGFKTTAPLNTQDSSGHES